MNTPEPPIQNVGVVDIYAKRVDGGVDLFIVCSGPLDPSPQIQKLLLDKIESYLEQIGAPDFRAEFDDPPAEKTRIIIATEFDVHPVVKLLIERSKPWVAEHAARLEVDQKLAR